MNKFFTFLFCWLAIVSCKDKEKENNAVGDVELKQTITPPKVTILADLPDSLKPKNVFLDMVPQPRTIVVPIRSGGSYSITNTKGKVTRKVNLEMPVNKLLPVLQDAKGEAVKDSLGNTFIMGTGGISSFTSFTTDNGLWRDVISCSITDKMGNIWFGTYGGGVSRYDGKSFTTFSVANGMANDDITSIAEDKTGNIWLGTHGSGVSRYDGRSFTTFSVSQGLANNEVSSITEDKTGNIWFGTRGGGVSRYDGKFFVTFSTAQGLANNEVNSIAEDKTGNIWFGTRGAGVSRFDGKSFTTFSVNNGLASNDVRSIIEDKTGNIWFGTYGGGVSRFDGKSFTTLSVTDGLAYDNVRSIFEDKAGNIWFGTSEGGVSRFDGKSFVSFSVAQGLANNEVNSIAEDKTGNLWFGTFGGGVSRYNGKSFTTFSVVQGLADNDVMSMAEDKTGNIWFGTYGGGVSRFDGKSFATFSVAQGLASEVVCSIFKDKKDHLWFGTYGGGVSSYDGKSFTTFLVAQGLTNNSIQAISGDKTGNIWFGTHGGGVNRYDGKSFTTFSVAQGLANNDVRCMCEDQTGTIWFGTNGGGVSSYDGKSLTTVSVANGLASNVVNSISEDKAGNIWFGTAEGLSVISLKDAMKLPAMTEKTSEGEERAFFKTFTKTDGLPDSFIAHILKMPDGKLAVGTRLGITTFSPSEDLTRLNDIEIYNSGTGYPVKDVNWGQHSMFLDSKGIIWIGTSSEKTALVRFDPSALPHDKNPPTLILKNIKVNEQSVCWYDLAKNKEKTDSNVTPAYITEEVTTLGRQLSAKERDSMKNRFCDIQFDSISRFYPIPQHLALPYHHNNITIDFNAIETGKPNLVNYQYILEGYDKEWSPVTKKTSATFGNIHEGTYIFKVKAQAPNGIWCEPVTYIFNVLPPWYRAWLAYLLYVVVTATGLYLIYRWRTASLRQRQKELEQTVTERTAEVVAEKKKSDDLLLNILPEEIANELKAKGAADAKLIDEVTVLFTDFKGFTQLSEKLSPKELVGEINECFSAFDHIMEKYGVEKIKTIGDSYMAAGGLPTANKTHPEDVVNAALAIQKYMADHKVKKEAAGELYFEIRIGVHTGPVVAGIVGVKKFAYDIWGDTVNTASRMESSGEIGKVNISGMTYELVKGKFQCEYRGKVSAKGKGEVDMYYVSAVL